MHTGKPHGKTILAGFVIAGALVLALPLPSQAQEKSFAGKSQSHADPHYLDNRHDMRIRLDVKWELAMSPYIDADHIKVLVRDGVVTLKGSVEDQSAFDAATRNAMEGGAKKVINLLTIENKK
ncbi:MAG: BON domain-containing protein [Nitrospiraceae bacterium]